jgi:integrase
MEDVTRHTRLKRRGSTYWFKAKVPRDLQGQGRFVTRKGTPKTEEAFSLGTRDPAEARRAVVEASLRFDDECARIRSTLSGIGRDLSQRELHALAGEWYRWFLAAREDDPGRPEDWEYEAEKVADGYHRYATPPDEDEDAELSPAARRHLRSVVSAVAGLPRFLLERSEVLSEGALAALLDTLELDLLAALKRLQRMAGGDYGPDRHAARFPKAAATATVQPAAQAPKRPAGALAVTVKTIVDGWKADRQGTAQMADAMTSTLQAFADHVVGAEPVGRSLAEATKADAVAWKAALQAAGRSPSTVFTYMSRASTMLKWAAASGLVPLNPLAGVPKPTQKRGKGRLVRPFTDAEAVLILADARSRQGAARWLPWVQAFSGARISEVAQANAADVREVDGIPCLVVTDVGEDGELVEGKSVKSEAGLRTIPLHPQVIAEGFLDYARSVPVDGSLFPELRPDKYGRRGTTASNNMSDQVRGLGITDKKVATSHSWRHRVKDALRNARVPGDVQDALLGHEAGGNAGRFYGLGFSVAVLAEAVAKITAPSGLTSHSDGASGAD